MQNTYQDLITEIQSKNPEITRKLEGGKKFKIKSDFKPAGLIITLFLSAR